MLNMELLLGISIFFVIFFVAAVAVRVALMFLRRFIGSRKRLEEGTPVEVEETRGGFFATYRWEIGVAAVLSFLLTGLYFWVELSETSFRRRAAHAEAKSNLAAIYATEVAYYVEWGRYVGNQPLTPVDSRRGSPDKTAWDADTRFSLLGFAPEGKVFFSYSLAGPNRPTEAQGFTARAEGDLDGDGKLTIYTITNSSMEITHTGDDF